MAMEEDLEPLEPDAWLSQFGRLDVSGFRVRPRAGVEMGISLIAARLTAEQAHRLVVRRGAFRRGIDAVRYTQVTDLVDAGFTVRREPTPLVPHHVLVEYDGEWDDDVTERFDACFQPPET